MLEELIGKLDRPPIIMGHSAGGAFTQILLDHGYGAAGVAINSAPTEGVKVIPLSQIKSSFPVLKNPANRHRAVGLTPEQWYYVFANTFSEEESLALYERYHIPASGKLFWGSALANINPGKDDTYVDYHNDARPPLLFISGKQDPLFPPKVGHSNVKHYKSNTVTEIVEYDGPHLLPAVPEWEAIADYALVEDPGHSEAVGEHAEAGAPRRRGERLDDRRTGRERCASSSAPRPESRRAPRRRTAGR